MVSPTDNAKLPVLATVFLAYELFFSNIKVFVKLVWIPFVVFLAADVFTLSFVISLPEESAGRVSFPGYWVDMICWLSTIPAITAWHRLVVFGADDPNARIRYSIEKPEFRYMGVCIVLYVAYVLAGTAINMVLALLAPLTGIIDSFMLTSLLVYIGFALALVVVARGLLALPAAAIGQSKTLRNSVRHSRGNGLRIALVYALAIAPSLFFSVFLGWILPDEESLPYAIALIFFWLFVGFFFFTMTISVLSIAYKLLVLPEETVASDTNE